MSKSDFSNTEFSNTENPEFFEPSSIKQLKVPLISLILSTFYPGMGQIYNGDSLKKGLLLIFGCMFGSFLFLIPGLIIWVYGMYDAYITADKMNKRDIAYREAKTKDILLLIIIPLIVMVILMFVSLIYAIHLLGSLDSIFPDLNTLLNHDIGKLSENANYKKYNI